MSSIPNDPVRDHRRQWGHCLYVYPVVSRRGKGLSIGVNLNPDRKCTFACVYCQIDRRVDRNLQQVDLAVLQHELTQVLDEAVSGAIWREDRFAAAPPEKRRLNDIAFSGDGEPTCLPNFDRAVAIAADARRRLNLSDLKIVVITNASQLHCPPFQRALPILDANNGQVWAKLDAGTEEYFLRVNRPYPRIALRRILDNILQIARRRPVVIQSLFLKLDGLAPPPAEIDAYCNNLREIVRGGGRIELVQIYSLARPPASPAAQGLDPAQLSAIAEKVREVLPAVPVEVF